MKKRKTDSAIEPTQTHPHSPPSSHSSPTHQETEYYDQDVRVWAVEYVPEVFSITKKTVKV